MRWTLFIVGVLMATCALSAPQDLILQGKIGAGFKAKTICSEVFVAGRDETAVLDTDLSGIDERLSRIRHSIDMSRQTVSASIFTINKTAHFYPGIGCVVGGLQNQQTSVSQVASGVEIPLQIEAAIQAKVDREFAERPDTGASLSAIVRGGLPSATKRVFLPRLNKKPGRSPKRLWLLPWAV